jgi:hypothetical protein
MIKPWLMLFVATAPLVACGGEGVEPAAESGVTTSAEASARDADLRWIEALERGDAATARELMAAPFQWIDTAGRLRGLDAALDDIGALAAGLRGERGLQTYRYGSIAVITSERAGERVMRVWARAPKGWHALAVIGTALTTGATPFAAGDAPTGDCDNPCRSLPYAPTTDNQRTIAELFMQLKLDEWQPNPERWADHVLDDVYYTTATAQLSKAARVEHLTALREAGRQSTPGDPVVSMQILDYGDAAVMFARHDSYRGGRPYWSVRVWAVSDGRWQLANTQQTVIAVPPG